MSADINVLVVDDIKQNLVATEALLRRPGLNILQASSGTEALEILLVQEVALALIDVQMPQMDGFELAELIRGNSRTKAVPLIFLTAAAQEPHRSFRGYQAGAVDFLNKPIEPTVLRSKVEVFVELYAQKKQISRQMEELQQALQMNEMFIAVLGHDLRTPLAAVATGAELILHLSDDQKVVAATKRIQSSNRRMEKMVSQLLEVARSRSGSIRLKLDNASYEEVCRNIVEEFRGVDGQSRIDVEFKGDMQGEFDVERIAQVLSNLAANSLQHGEADAPVRITIDGSQSETVLITVSNKGCIEPHLLGDIFKPFRSMRRDGVSSAGLGLGLYIVKRFVEAHGGHAEVRSTQEEGTKLQIRLPRRPPTAA